MDTSIYIKNFYQFKRYNIFFSKNNGIVTLISKKNIKKQRFPIKTIIFFSKKKGINFFFKNKSFYSKFFKNFTNTNKMYYKRIGLNGIGFKVEGTVGKVLILSLGYSHTIHCQIPSSINYKLNGDNSIILYSINKQKLNEVTKKIIELRNYGINN